MIYRDYHMAFFILDPLSALKAQGLISGPGDDDGFDMKNAIL